MPKLSQNQIDQIADLLEAGWTNGRLAIRFNVSKSTIQWHALKLGILSARPCGLNDHAPMVTMRAGKPVRRFTPEEDARILALRPTVAPHSIAKHLGRNPKSIYARLYTIARREEVAL